MIKSTIIKERTNKNGLNKVYIRYTHNRKFCLFSTEKIYVKPLDFNYSSGKIRKTDNNHILKNRLIDKYITDIEKVILELKINDVEPTIENVKNKFRYNYEPTINKIEKPFVNHKTSFEPLEPISIVDNIEKTSTSFYDIWNEYLNMKLRSKQFGQRTYKSNLTTIKYLKLFTQNKNYPVDFNSINKQFYNLFIDYLFNNRNLTNNSVDGYIKNLKTFMIYSYKEQLHNNREYEHLKRTTKECNIITLEREEIIKLLSVKTTKKNEKYKYMILLQLNTGLRYNDLKNLTKDNFTIFFHDRGRKDDVNFYHSYLTLNTEKTGTFLKIPINNNIYVVYKKYFGNGVDFTKTNLITYNKYIRMFCKDVGIDSNIETFIFKGNERIKTTQPKYEVITSHSLRKTFISQSLRGSSPNKVMSITGHKTYSSFRKYVNMDTDSKRDVMNTLQSMNYFVDEE